MNERMKELILKAGFPKFDEMYIVTDGEELQKFAELIIKECADLCDRFQARDVGMQPAECAGAIRKMFGVEE